MQSFDDFVLNQEADNEQDKGDPRNDPDGQVFLFLKMGADIRRSPQSGKSRDHADQEKRDRLDGRQPRDIDESVFGDTGDQKKDEHRDLGFWVIDEELELLEFFGGNERSDQRIPEEPDSKKDDRGAEEGSEDRIESPQGRPESITAGDLDNLPRDEGDNDLDRLDQDEDQRADGTVRGEIFLELIGMADQTRDTRRVFDRDEDNQGQENREQNSMNEEMTFTVLILHLLISFSLCPFCAILA